VDECSWNNDEGSRGEYCVRVNVQGRDVKTVKNCTAIINYSRVGIKQTHYAYFAFR
jgi:hypothetical protein